MRDGRYIDTVQTARTPDRQDHRDDGRPDDLRGRRPRCPSSRDPRSCSRCAASTAAAWSGTSASSSARRDPRLRRPDGRRPHRGRARHLRRRPARIGRDPRPRQAGHASAARATPSATASATCRRTASATASRWHGRRDQHRAGLAAALRWARSASSGRATTRRAADCAGDAPRDQDAVRSRRRCGTCRAATSRRSSSPSG